MDTSDDPIGTEGGETEWVLLAYFVYAAVAFFIFGFMIGWYMSP